MSAHTKFTQKRLQGDKQATYDAPVKVDPVRQFFETLLSFEFRKADHRLRLSLETSPLYSTGRGLEADLWGGRVQVRNAPLLGALRSTSKAIAPCVAHISALAFEISLKQPETPPLPVWQFARLLEEVPFFGAIPKQLVEDWGFLVLTREVAQELRRLGSYLYVEGRGPFYLLTAPVLEHVAIRPNSSSGTASRHSQLPGEVRLPKLGLLDKLCPKGLQAGGVLGELQDLLVLEKGEYYLPVNSKTLKKLSTLPDAKIRKRRRLPANRLLQGLYHTMGLSGPKSAAHSWGVSLDIRALPYLGQNLTTFGIEGVSGAAKTLAGLLNPFRLEIMKAQP